MREKIISRYTPWFMVFLGGIFYCYEYMIRVSPSVMIPELMKSFSIQATEIGLLSAFYYWGYVTGSLLVGPMVDKYGPKKVLVCATLVCGIGCCFFGMSQSFLLAELSRLFIGLGSAFAFIGLLSLGAVWLAPNCFGRLAGFSSMLGMLSAMVGQNWFSQLIVHFSWQELSLYSGAVGIFIVIILCLFLKEKPKNAIATHSSYTFKELAMAFKRLGKQNAFWSNCIVGLTTFLPIIIFAELWGVPFLQERYDLSRDIAAMYASMVFMGWAIGGPSFGLLYDVLRKWRDIFWLGTLVATVTSAMVLYVALPVSSLPYILFVFGFSASSHVLVFVSSRQMSPKGVEATALGITNLVMMSAGVIVQPLIGGMIDYLAPVCASMGIEITTVQSYQFALALLPLALLWTLRLIRKVGKSLPAEEVIAPQGLLIEE